MAVVAFRPMEIAGAPARIARCWCESGVASEVIRGGEAVQAAAGAGQELGTQQCPDADHAGDHRSVLVRVERSAIMASRPASWRSRSSTLAASRAMICVAAASPATRVCCAWAATRAAAGELGGRTGLALAQPLLEVVLIDRGQRSRGLGVADQYERAAVGEVQGRVPALGKCPTGGSACGCQELCTPHATCRYSWTSPPRRSVDGRCLKLRRGVLQGRGRRGAAWPRVRCGR